MAQPATESIDAWDDVAGCHCVGGTWIASIWKMWQKMLIRKQDEMEEGGREGRLMPVVISELL